MDNFRVIAIRTGSEINKDITDSRGTKLDFLKVLKPHTLYQFTNDYVFNLEDSDEIDPKTGKQIKYVSSIDHDPKAPENLYYIHKDTETIPLYISAIVGKNGSGKSTILELLFVSIYNLAVSTNILKVENRRKLKMMLGVEAEIYYVADNNIIKLKLIPKFRKKDLVNEDVSFEIIKFKNSETERQFKIDHVLDNTKEILSQYLFYTIGINYSHYSLNSQNIGDWVTNVFHKNDGYQTPIVLNPFRAEGVININNEEYLTKSRLVSNLVTRSQNNKLIYSEIITGKVARKIKFKFNSKKTKIYKSFEPVFNILNTHKDFILDDILYAFRGLDPSQRKPIISKLTEHEYKPVVTYILRKLYSITEKYYPYNTEEYKIINKENKSLSFNDSNLSKLIKKLSHDQSHVTFKLIQAVNYLVNLDDYKTVINQVTELEVISKFLYSLKDRYDEAIINLIPPSFFDIDIEFEDNSYFNKLSSGEKQQAYSSTTYLYHIANVNSVSKNENLIKYKYINIVFDEIELYYHPDLQKAFVKNICDNLTRLNMPDIKGINCILVTHSPFILSDIPNSNILKLDKGTVAEFKTGDETFGANIYDLLQNDFFMEDGFIGVFAKERINKLIDEIKGIKESDTSESKSELWSLIKIIGEPFIKEELVKLYYEKLPKEYKKEQEIKQLQDKIDQLRNA